MKILDQFDLILKEWRRDIKTKTANVNDLKMVEEKFFGKHGKLTNLKILLGKMPSNEKAYLEGNIKKLTQEMAQLYDMRMSDFGIAKLARKAPKN